MPYPVSFFAPQVRLARLLAERFGLALADALLVYTTQAWASYPRPYREIAHVAISLGQHCFGRYFDFAWSYMAIPAETLRQLVPRLQQRTFGLLAEMVLLLRGKLQTQEVDWLFWEDPFIDGARVLLLPRHAAAHSGRALTSRRGVRRSGPSAPGSLR